MNLPAVIEEKGDEGLLEELCGGFAEGEHIVLMCERLGLGWLEVRRWLEGDVRRMEEFGLAKRAYADRLAFGSVKTVDEATVETASLSKLQSDVYLKMAGKLNKVEWGEGEVEKRSFGSGGITIVIGNAEPKMVTVDG